MLKRAEVDRLRELVVEAFMAKDEAAYLATCRLLVRYISDSREAEGYVKVGAGTWTKDPGLFSFEHRHRRRGLSDAEIQIKAQERGRRLSEAARRRRRRHTVDSVLRSCQ